MALRRRVLGRGYYPAKLPPPPYRSSHSLSRLSRHNCATPTCARVCWVCVWYVAGGGQAMVSKLLRVNRLKRLGCGTHGVEEVKSDRFFGDGLDWRAL